MALMTLFPVMKRALVIHCMMSHWIPLIKCLIGSEVLSDHVFVTLEHFSPTKGYSEICWLLLSSLKKVGNEKDELRASNPQLKLRINDLKAPISVLKETLRVKVSENQTQSLILPVADIQFQVFGRLL